jgi:hypothetical protein
VAEAVVERTLYRTGALRLGEFRCPPESPRWRRPNETPGRAHVAFPGTSAIIRHAGAEPVLANANHAVFYNPGQRYRRALHDPRGDRCWFLELAPALASELGEFRFAAGPADARARLLLHVAVRHLEGGRRASTAARIRSRPRTASSSSARRSC